MPFSPHDARDADVWTLWHIPPASSGLGDGLLIGIYSTRIAAKSAAERLARQPGFRDHPTIVDDSAEPGFFVERYPLDTDHWAEGYRTEPDRDVGIPS